MPTAHSLRKGSQRTFFLVSDDRLLGRARLSGSRRTPQLWIGK
jgi:hypothetical protein